MGLAGRWATSIDSEATQASLKPLWSNDQYSIISFERYRLGGPDMIRLPDGRFVAVVRLYDGSVRTSVCWLDPEQSTLTDALKLPAGGDTGYAGLVWHEGLLWISYYSSREGKTSIYLAKVRVER